MRQSQDNRKRKHLKIEMNENQEECKEKNKYETKIREHEDEIDQFKEREDLFLKDKEKLVILYQEGYINSDC